MTDCSTTVDRKLKNPVWLARETSLPLGQETHYRSNFSSVYDFTLPRCTPTKSRTVTTSTFLRASNASNLHSSNPLSQSCQSFLTKRGVELDKSQCHSPGRAFASDGLRETIKEGNHSGNSSFKLQASHFPTSLRRRLRRRGDQFPLIQTDVPLDNLTIYRVDYKNGMFPTTLQGVYGPIVKSIGFD
ncbi:unnamed protein product [Protopolystoma xenopodis]|uniref:Uncharacterized protein n=1 Tax=Protopolystoma xenopodis TaxID=117903 RepID=A0A3S5CI65_9PLAT|nr:unnamed protein product [Protopolystoma xenopodis]